MYKLIKLSLLILSFTINSPVDITTSLDNTSILPTTFPFFIGNLISFKFTDNEKEYMVYTKNETDENGNVTIYVASVNRDQGEDPKLGAVESDEEWNRIKHVLKELSKNVD